MKKLLLIPALFIASIVQGQVMQQNEGLVSIQGNETSRQFLLKACHHFYRKPNADSALHYVSLAQNYAVKINDTVGITSALLLHADIEGRLKGNPAIMQAEASTAYHLARLKLDLKGMASAFRLLALSYILQGDKARAEQYLSDALNLTKMDNDRQGMGWAYFYHGFYYSKKGTFLKAFDYLSESLAISSEIDNRTLKAITLFFIARSFNHSGDPQKAIEYYHQAFDENESGFLLLWPHMEDMGLAYLKLNKLDSAIYYQQKHRTNIALLTTDNRIRERFSKWILPDFHLEKELRSKEYLTVLHKLLPSLDESRNEPDVLLHMHSLLLTAKAYEGLQQYQKALLCTRELLQYGIASDNSYFLAEGYLQKAGIFRKLNQHDSAWQSMHQHLAVKEKLTTEQLGLREGMYHTMAAADKRIALLNKDKLIYAQQMALKEKELKESSQMFQWLIFTMIAVVIIGMIIVLNILLKKKNDKLKYEQTQAAFQKKALELEMQALRAQMNPHFIFNCLSAIDSLIHNGEADKATVYLAYFAKLIRQVLDSSKSNLVPFQDDFETMKLYLELEHFRSNHKFNYKLLADEELLQGDYKVPPLIAQPFIENAIHHGLLNKQDEDRKLEISAFLSDGHIIYRVYDNGVGRRKAAVLKELNKPEHRSYGIDITRERVYLHNRNSQQTNVSFTDLEEPDGKSNGTIAIVKINSDVLC